LSRLSDAALLRAGGRQRTDFTHVLAAVRTLNGWSSSVKRCGQRWRRLVSARVRSRASTSPGGEPADDLRVGRVGVSARCPMSHLAPRTHGASGEDPIMNFRIARARWGAGAVAAVAAVSLRSWRPILGGARQEFGGDAVVVQTDGAKGVPARIVRRFSGARNRGAPPPSAPRPLNARRPAPANTPGRGTPVSRRVRDQKRSNN
jgi:hypothetical protein